MSRSWYESSHFTEKMTEVLKDKVTKSGLWGDSGISLVLLKHAGLTTAATSWAVRATSS